MCSPHNLYFFMCSSHHNLYFFVSSMVVSPRAGAALRGHRQHLWCRDLHHLRAGAQTQDQGIREASGCEWKWNRLLNFSGVEKFHAQKVTLHYFAFFFSLQCFLFVYLIRHPFNLIGKSDLAGKGMTDREAWHEGSMSRLSLSADVIIAAAVDTVNNAVMESVWLVNSSCPVLTTVRGAVKVRCVGFLPPISHTLLHSQLITTRVAFTGRKASHAWLQNDHAVLQWH